MEGAAERPGTAVPVDGLRSIRICRYFGEPAHGLPVGQVSMLGHLAKERLIRSARASTSLARSFDRLGVFPATPNGEISCPGDNGASMYLLFGYIGSATKALIVRLTGCPRVYAPAKTSTIYNLSSALRRRLEGLVPLQS